MNNQVLSFSLLAAALGMGVVFLFLGILSVLMAAIKRFFGDGESSPQSAVASSGGPTASNGPNSASAVGDHNGAGSGVDPAGVPDWVMAAVVAFVMEEQNEFQRTASAWLPEPGRGSDAWALPGKRG